MKPPPRSLFKHRTAERKARWQGVPLSDPATGCRLLGGQTYELRHVHDATCPRPRGGRCTCRSAPVGQLRPLFDPASN